MMKRLVLLTVIMLLGVNSYAAPVPDTGHTTTCYDDVGNVIACPSPGQPFYGQDANYSINPMSYTKLDGNGNALLDSATEWVMVRDNVTGLIWEVKTNKDGVPNYNDPHDADNTYTWFDPTCIGCNGTQSDHDTQDFVSQLNDSHFGGYTDWRLPNSTELSFLVDRRLPMPGPTINTFYFPNAAQNWHWSSTFQFATNFYAGYSTEFYNRSLHYSYYLYSAIAVRGLQSKSSYVDNGDGTVTDVSTGLMWQKETADNYNPMTWKDALYYCENLSLGGYIDWRLPNINELRSLVDYLQHPSINITFFPDTADYAYWSSTTTASCSGGAWYLDFSDGYDSYLGIWGGSPCEIFISHYKSNNYYVRAIRGGQSGALINFAHLDISVNSPTQQVNVPFPVTIAAKDENGNTDTSFSGTVGLTSSLGKIYPTEVQVINGTASVENVTMYNGGTGYISASGFGLYGNSNSFVVTGSNAGSGKLVGYVRNNDNIGISNATVYLDEQAKITNSKGYFEFSDLPCKTSVVSAEGPDGTRSLEKSIEISAGNPIAICLRVNSCDTGRTPILLVPGIMGSSVGSNNSFPYLPKNSPSSWNSSVWATESYGLYDLYGKPGWRKLIDGLKPYGYFMGCNLFAVPYDWRMPIGQASKKYLKQAIEDILNKTGYPKVHVIAHSMGGLLTRYYIQNIDGSKIDRFAMVGTPNHGSATPYYMWFGGDPKKADDITAVFGDVVSAVLNFYSFTTQLNYSNMKDGKRLFPYTILNWDYTDWGDANAQKEARSFYREKIPTMGQLLLASKFLKRDDSTFGLSDCSQDNQDNLFLETLNKNVDFKNTNKVKLFEGNNQKTIETIYVGNQNEMYVCGKPKMGWPDMPKSGDGTVLTTSANISGLTEPTSTQSSSHGTLIDNFRSEIISFITGETVSQFLFAGEMATSSPGLSVSINGPVSPLMVSPSGKQIGFSPDTGSFVNDYESSADLKMDNETGYLSISNPENGTYRLELRSNYQRNFFGNIGYFDETRMAETPFSGFVQNGVFVIHFVVNKASSSIITIDSGLNPPENLQANPVENNGLKTRLTWSQGGQQDIAGYRVYSRQADAPYFELLWNGMGTTLNTSDDWAANNDIATVQYAVSAVLSDGTETLLSEMVENNDRDHDGLTDVQEMAIGTDMNNADTDGDGLTDGQEYVYGTNPILIDTDGDGYSDYIEIQSGSDPLDKSSFSPAAPVPDTGQKKCYDVSGNVITCPSPGQTLYGQDANYSINPMSYTKLDGSGNALPDSATEWVMVRDNVTGLIWENKTTDGTIHDVNNTYTWYDSNPTTNGGDAGSYNTGVNTEAFINALNSDSFGGYTDWRLPSFKELDSIAKYENQTSDPKININYFPNTRYSFYWSTDTFAFNTSSAWGVPFIKGSGDASSDKNTNFYVRAVRGGNSQPLYVDNSNGTITDNITGLMWQQAHPDNVMTWQQALSYCENLTLGGYTDWRLPTKKELRTLLDLSKSYPAINSTYFPDTTSTIYWTSTTYDNSSYAWSIDFALGYSTTGYGGGKADNINVRAVRGGQISIIPLKGDINSNGIIDLSDAILSLQVLSGMLPDNINPAADVDGDGKIGMAEAIYVMQVVAGLRAP